MQREIRKECQRRGEEMSELKTLKDISVWKFDKKVGDYQVTYPEYQRRLRQEAIKRIKVWEIQKIRFKEIGNEAGVNCVQQIQNEFLDFFNITKEDLDAKQNQTEVKK